MVSIIFSIYTKGQRTKMMSTKILLVMAVAATLVSCADAKYYNVVSWALWGNGNGNGCEGKFASKCMGSVERPVAAWLQLVGDHIDILDIKSFYSQKYDVYSDCWCRTTIYYSTDNATYVQGQYGQPVGSDESAVANAGAALLPSMVMAFVMIAANML